MIKYSDTHNPADCYGCGACEQICGHHALLLKANSDGFLYPEIDAEKCTNCGLCEKVCPIDVIQEGQVKRTIVAQYQDESLMDSASGGVFKAVADYVLEHDGYVAGCVFDESFNAIHILSNVPKDIARMQGSKYVQSKIGNVYKGVRQKLCEEKLVLFSGTPCQVAGLKRFLMKDYDNLITIDLICHGVPSPKLLQEYLNTTFRIKGKVIDFKFRDKRRNGWCSQGSVTIESNRGIKVKRTTPYTDSYYYYYLANDVSRICCYTCKYSSTSRVGDITIGDYWNLQKILPNFNCKNGASVVLVNSEIGRKVISDICGRLIHEETQLQQAVNANGNLKAPCRMPEKRDGIYKEIDKYGYRTVEKNECHYQYVMPALKRMIPVSFKRMIRKILK